MNHTHLAACCFPTTVVFIDDSRGFLNGLKMALDRKIATSYFFDRNLAALDFLKETSTKTSFISRCISHPEEQHKDERYLHVNVAAISQEIYNPHRFKEIAIIVVDYAMPGMNGLEVSQKIKEMRNEYKIILLTGEADERLAVEAFNKGLIHHFVNKNTKDFSQQLNQAIYQLQLEYFQDTTSVIINSLTQNTEEPPSCLNDPTFIQFFNQFLAKQNVTEFYLTDACGSILLLDATAKPSWLAVKDSDHMESMIFDVEHSDFTVPSDLLAALKNKTHILHFNDNDALWRAPELWKNYLFPAQSITGKETYYYAFITDPTKFDIHREKIVSYQSYLAQRQI